MSMHKILTAAATPGVLLILMGVCAMLISNSSLSDIYFLVLHANAPFNLLTFINDGLMAIFFLYIGMEIKQQLFDGHLSNLKQAMLPVFAACGGVLVPALIFIYFNWDLQIALRGWAIPTATDIAFALGVIILLGARLPQILKVILLAVAIIDDLIAILIISIYYTHDLSPIFLLICVLLIAKLFLLNHRNCQNLAVYLLVGLILWACMLKSGIHPTISGVILAFAIPLAMQKKLFQTLGHWVEFLILPLFALANAGISLQNLSLQQLLDPVPIGIALGLIFGKQIGVISFAWLSVKSKFAFMPAHLKWSHLYGMAILCGIGFTMSIFIGNLAYGQISAEYALINKVGVLVGSTVSAVLGYVYLRLILSGKPDSFA